MKIFKFKVVQGSYTAVDGTMFTRGQEFETSKDLSDPKYSGAFTLVSSRDSEGKPAVDVVPPQAPEKLNPRFAPDPAPSTTPVASETDSPTPEGDKVPDGNDSDRDDAPKPELKMVHKGGGKYDVLNVATGEKINKRFLNKKEATELVG